MALVSEVTADALDDIRERGRHVTVLFPAVAAFMAGNPQFTDLIDSEHPGR